MIVERQKNYISGSEVLKEEVLREQKKKVDSLKEFKKENYKNKRQKQNLKRMNMIKGLSVFFLVAMTIMVRYSIIYSTQKQIINLKSEITKVKCNSDELKVALLKHDNINEIDAKAKTEYGMKEPRVANTYYYDLSKNNFAEVNSNSNKNTTILDRILKYLF